MARINSERVEKYLDYERDIKGKRLIRLSAGVCAGKNTAFIKMLNKFPNLRVLFITSRKNTVLSQIKKMKAIPFRDFDDMNKNKESFNDIGDKGFRVICTNASIINFFKSSYKKEDTSTYLWEKFDLIILDEAHSLTTDANFIENFYVERFLKHTFYKNPNCDIVFMSGTLTPLNWMIDAKNTPPIHDLDYFDKCIHLEPEYVLVVDKDIIPKYLYNKCIQNERIVYFANKKKNIAELSSYLVEHGIPVDALGYSFNFSEDDRKLNFPQAIKDTLENRINDINIELTVNEKVPQNIKILFSTSKNKEGININDDDIKIAIAETHNKADLIQIAGRVRGNPNNGEGITTLIIVACKEQFKYYPDDFTYIFNKHIAKGLTKTYNDTKSKKTIRNPSSWLKKLPQYEKDRDAYRYIRYDYIGENFAVYEGYYEQQKQNINNIIEFEDILNNAVLRKDSSGNCLVFSGKEIMEQEWFKWSKVFILSKHKTNEKKNNDLNNFVRVQLLEFLKQNNFIGENTQITIHDRDVIIRSEIERLAELFGYSNLGIKKGFKYVGNILKKFGITISEKTKRKGYETFTLQDCGIRG